LCLSLLLHRDSKHSFLETVSQRGAAEEKQAEREREMGRERGTTNVDVADPLRTAPAGNAVAPYFAIGMVFFLMIFVAYFTIAVVAIAVDFSAMDSQCAEVCRVENKYAPHHRKPQNPQKPYLFPWPHPVRLHALCPHMQHPR
jgi:hypothetical protein